MPAILAKKLGMTQRFLDDGRVERVTVLEAGPCPVTAIRTPLKTRDGVADAPIDPGLRMLCEPWARGPLLKL